MTVAHQAPLSLRFPRQEYWSALPFPTPSEQHPEIYIRTSLDWSIREAPITKGKEALMVLATKRWSVAEPENGETKPPFDHRALITESLAKTRLELT